MMSKPFPYRIDSNRPHWKSSLHTYLDEFTHVCTQTDRRQSMVNVLGQENYFKRAWPGQGCTLRIARCNTDRHIMCSTKIEWKNWELQGRLSNFKHTVVTSFSLHFSAFHVAYCTSVMCILEMGLIKVHFYPLWCKGNIIHLMDSLHTSHG